MKEKSKFIIFGQGRSGSNLLRNLLNTHPDIYCDVEILSKQKLSTEKWVKRYLKQKFPGYYLEYKNFRYKENIYGMKLFYHHLTNHEKVLNQLINHHWKIIHIYRKNTLKQAVSWMIAKMDGTWINRDGKKTTNEKIYRIDPAELLRIVENRLKKMEQELQLMEKFENIKIVYEEDLYFSSEWQRTMARVFEYLNTYPVEVKSNTLKTDSRTDAERIENFGEIMDYLNQNGYDYLVKQYEELNKIYS